MESMKKYSCKDSQSNGSQNYSEYKTVYALRKFKLQMDISNFNKLKECQQDINKCIIELKNE